MGLQGKSYHVRTTMGLGLRLPACVSWRGPARACMAAALYRPTQLLVAALGRPGPPTHPARGGLLPNGQYCHGKRPCALYPAAAKSRQKGNSGYPLGEGPKSAAYLAMLLMMDPACASCSRASEVEQRWRCLPQEAHGREGRGKESGQHEQVMLVKRIDCLAQGPGRDKVQQANLIGFGMRLLQAAGAPVNAWIQLCKSYGLNRWGPEALLCHVCTACSTDPLPPSENPNGHLASQTTFGPAN